MPIRKREFPHFPTAPLKRAYVACLCLGLACLCWGLAPAVVDGVITRRVPRAEALAIGSLTATIGVTFLGLHVFVRRGRRWAMWTALCLATLMVGFALPTLLARPGGASATFLPVLATAVAVMNWLALRPNHTDIVEPKPAATNAWKANAGVSHLLPSFAQQVTGECNKNDPHPVAESPRPVRSAKQPPPAAGELIGAAAENDRT